YTTLFRSIGSSMACVRWITARALSTEAGGGKSRASFPPYLCSRCSLASSCSERAAGFGALWFCVQGPTLDGVRLRRRVAKKLKTRYSAGLVLSRRQPLQIKIGRAHV